MRSYLLSIHVFHVALFEQNHFASGGFGPGVQSVEIDTAGHRIAMAVGTVPGKAMRAGVQMRI
jgi:hypothetical protein